MAATFSDCIPEQRCAEMAWGPQPAGSRTVTPARVTSAVVSGTGAFAEVEDDLLFEASSQPTVKAARMEAVAASKAL